MESREIKESSRYQPIIDLPNKIIGNKLFIKFILVILILQILGIFYIMKN